MFPPRHDEYKMVYAEEAFSAVRNSILPGKIYCCGYRRELLSGSSAPIVGGVPIA